MSSPGGIDDIEDMDPGLARASTGQIRLITAVVTGVALAALVITLVTGS